MRETSQGRLYSGMAFRMMRDMGIHIQPHQLVGQYQEEELRLRQQLFWSYYTWDKTMSSCLGRAPTTHDRIPLPENLIDGDEAENDSWRPRFATRVASEGRFRGPGRSEVQVKQQIHCLL
jgi:hypothetical protein